MKLLKLSFICLSILLVAGCNDDEKSTPKLAGEWNLTNVMGGLLGVNDTFPNGTVTWNFNTANGTVTVVNNNTDEAKQDILPSGTYDYDINTNDVNVNGCDKSIVIDGSNYGCYNIADGQLNISQLEADGFLITLKR